jgi:2-polyprenyl-3-methyl-5-hydroxy-6-metoxy-1,4-benzoquinol methylase
MNQYFVQRTSCPACGSTNFKRRVTISFDDPGLKGYMNNFYDSQGGIEWEYLKDADFILSECNDCGLVFHEQIPNDELMSRLYDKWIDPQKVIDKYVTKDNVDYYKRYAAEVINLIIFFKTLPINLKFFDFGMGWGKWALMAKAFGVDAYGSELSEHRVEFARKNGVKVLTWDEIPGKEFDYINTEQVFEHIPDPLGTMRHLAKGLKSGGIIKISVPNGDGIDRILKHMNWNERRGGYNSLMMISPLEHINTYKRGSIKKMAEVAGLEPVKFKSEFLGIRNYKDLGKIALRKTYYKYWKTGDFAFYFRKK